MADYPNGGIPPQITTHTTQPSGLPNTGSHADETALAGASAVILGVVLLLAVAVARLPKRRKR